MLVLGGLLCDHALVVEAVVNANLEELLWLSIRALKRQIGLH